MKIHILSDLHTEFAQYIPSDVALDVDLVILAGDIGTKGRGVEWARKAFNSPVIYVAGNHEYFREHIDNTLEKMRAASCERVRVLDNEEWIINGVRFLGATCWTDFSSTGNSILAKYEAQRGLNDYRKIRTAGYRKVMPDDLALRNQQSLVWLRDRLAEPFEGQTVVVTHHAPSLISMGHPPLSERSEFDKWRSIMGDCSKIGSTYIKPACPEVPHIAAAYANNLESMMGESIALWVHGHVHRAADYNICGTRIVCNPKGYPSESTGFNKDLIIEVTNTVAPLIDQAPIGELEQFDEIIKSYAAGHIARRDVEEITGLWFSDILEALGRLGLQLPRVDTRAHYNKKQMALFDSIFNDRGEIAMTQEAPSETLAEIETNMDIPTSGLRSYILDLAKQHNAIYVKTYADEWADTITRLSDDGVPSGVESDDVGNLLIALKRAGILTEKDMLSLLVNYLREKSNDGIL